MKTIKRHQLDPHTNLLVFPGAEQVIDCLENKKGFGLQNGNKTVIFDVENLIAYEYRPGNIVRVKCNDVSNFMNYLQTIAVDHQTFVTQEKCFEIIRNKKMIETDLSIMQKLK